MSNVKLDSMYSLTKTFKEAISMVDDDGVLTDQALETIQKMEGDILTKTGNIFGVKAYIEGQIALMKEQEKYIKGKRGTWEKNLLKLRELFEMGLDTIAPEIDKNGKKTQKIKSLYGTAYYSFKENIEYEKEAIEDKYKSVEKKLGLSDEFDLEELKRIAPHMVTETEIEKIDYDKMKTDFDNGEEVKGMEVYETKTLNLRK